MALSMRDEPGTQREFETIFILRPDTNQDGIQLVNTRVKGVIEQLGGRVIKLDNWGKRKLAYPIKKNEHGVYVFYTVELPAEAVRKVESVLNITDEVLRFLITRPDLKAIAKAEAEKAVKAKRAAERASRDTTDEDTEKDEA